MGLFFLWIPKTGGTSLHNAFLRWGLQHCSIRYDEVTQGMPVPEGDYVAGHWSAKGLDILEGWFSVTILRNPIDRLVSHYNYCHEHGDDLHPEHAAFVKRVSFSEWARSPYCVDNLQTRYLCDKVVDNLEWAYDSLARLDVVGILFDRHRGLDYIMRETANALNRMPNLVGHDRKSTYYVHTSDIPRALFQELWDRNGKDRALLDAVRERVQ